MSNNSDGIWVKVTVNDLLFSLGAADNAIICGLSFPGGSNKDELYCTAILIYIEGKTFFLSNTFLLEDKEQSDLYESLILSGPKSFFRKFSQSESDMVSIYWLDQHVDFGPSESILIDDGDKFSVRHLQVLKTIYEGNIYDSITSIYFISNNNFWRLSVLDNRPDTFLLSKIRY